MRIARLKGETTSIKVLKSDIRLARQIVPKLANVNNMKELFNHFVKAYHNSLVDSSLIMQAAELLRIEKKLGVKIE